MQTAHCFYLAFAFVTIIKIVTADQPCSQLLADGGDKVKVHLCQLSSVAKITDDFLSSITYGLNEILAEQGNKAGQ